MWRLDPGFQRSFRESTQNDTGSVGHTYDTPDEIKARRTRPIAEIESKLSRLAAKATLFSVRW
jgi:hypothetical protein